MSSKIKTTKQIESLSKSLRKKGKKIIFTNGCFDILHAGHVMYLAKAKKLGDVLILGLNSDRSIREIKGPTRPINSQKARGMVLAGLEAVDYVVVFNESTPLKLINKIKPHVLVKGSDWVGKAVAGAKEMLAWKGKVKFVPLLHGYSTTNTIKKIAS